MVPIHSKGNSCDSYYLHATSVSHQAFTLIFHTNLALYSRDLSEAINDSTYTEFCQYHLLKMCLIFMVLCGNEGQMEKLGFLPNKLQVRCRMKQEKEDSPSFIYRYLTQFITYENPHPCNCPFFLRAAPLSSHSSSVGFPQSCRS